MLILVIFGTLIRILTVAVVLGGIQGGGGGAATNDAGEPSRAEALET